MRTRLKGGKMRYVPLSPKLDQEFRRYPATPGEDRTSLPKLGAKGGCQRVERSFRTILRMAGVESFRFHDLLDTLASWYMMNGGDLHELAKILGHSNIRSYAKLARSHMARTGDMAQETWKMMAGKTRDNVRATA